MVTSSVAAPLLVLLCLSACSAAKQDPAPPSPPPAIAGAASDKTSATRCAPPAPGTATSKVRHVPDENDPCANSRGLSTH